jgi:hypothetical protein
VSARSPTKVAAASKTSGQTESSDADPWTAVAAIGTLISGIAAIVALFK